MKKKQGLIALLIVAVLAAGIFTAYRFLKPQAQEGAKTITVNIDHLEGADTSYTIRTDEEYLRGALEQEDLVEGTESEYGLYILTLDGERAQEDQQQWWGYDVNGEAAQYGVDGQVVTDGDVYDFTLNAGW